MDVSDNQTLRPAPIPEWWQAASTIVGLVGSVYACFAVLPALQSGLPEALREFLFSGQAAVKVMLCAIATVFVLYVVACLSDKNYLRLELRFRLRPWIVFLGVLCPLIPTVFSCGEALWHQRVIPDYYSAVGLASVLVPVFTWIAVYKTLFQFERPGRLVMALNAYSLAIGTVAALLFPFIPWVMQPREASAAAMASALVGAILYAISAQCGSEKPSRSAQVVGLCAFLSTAIAFGGPQLSFEFHSTLINSALSPSADTHRAAIRVLRAFGSSDELRRGSYGALVDRRSFLQGESAPTPEDYQRAHYWVTGTPFNDQPAPWDVQLTQYLRGDADLASSRVGARVAGLAVNQSSINALIDEKLAVARLTWDLSFTNATAEQQEARAEICIPNGSVVSRAVLWVHGTPREAVISGVSAARQAYESVVRAQRDPLLISWKSPDRLLLQCYPVPPQTTGEDMRVQLQIATPMNVGSRVDSLDLALPWISESNCTVGKHGAKFSKLGKLADRSSWTYENIAHRYSVDAKLDVENYTALMLNNDLQIHVLIDGSANMAKYREVIVQCLSHLAGNPQVRQRLHIVFASDEVSRLVALHDTADATKAIAALNVVPFTGGPDNTRDLQRLIAEIGDNPKAALVWIHGAQPLPTGIDCRGTACMLYDVHLGNGTNAVLEGQLEPIRVQIDHNQMKSQLAALFDRLAGSGFEHLPKATFEENVVTWCTTGLSRECSALATYSQICDLCKHSDFHSAEAMAIQSRLVTPATSAVVLETDEDYVNYGLPNISVSAEPHQIAVPVEEFYRWKASDRAGYAPSGKPVATAVATPLPEPPSPSIVLDSMPIVHDSRSAGDAAGGYGGAQAESDYQAMSASNGMPMSATTSSNASGKAAEKKESVRWFNSPRKAQTPAPATGRASYLHKMNDDKDCSTAIRPLTATQPQDLKLAVHGIAAILILLVGAGCTALILLARRSGRQQSKRALVALMLCLASLIFVGTKLSVVFDTMTKL